MEALKQLINEFAIFSAPTPDDTGTGEEGQDQSFDFSVGDEPKTGDVTGDDEITDEEPEHDPETCPCPCHKHDDEEGSDLEDNDNIEVIDGDDGEFSLEDEEDGEKDGTEESTESKYKMF